MDTSLLQAKTNATLGFVFWAILMLVGFALSRGPLSIGGIALSVFAMYRAARHFSRLAAIIGIEVQHRRTRGPKQDRSSIARRVFWLLFTVAEVDGRSGAAEMDLVRRFVLERFMSPEVISDLTTWTAPRLQGQDLEQLVGLLRAQLSDAECETLFWWCCLISLIDERFTQTEHGLLQTIARHLGMPPLHAQRLFQHAKARVLAEQGQNTERRQFRGHRDGQGQRGAPRQTTTPGSRSRALHILGLDESADESTIRKRHRELVKRYHPDAHSNLGPVAAEEATERFREVQEAYETLRGNR